MIKKHRLRSSLLLCTADGVALGAAATTDQAGVEMIVFIAIMLHKVLHRTATHESVYTITVYACYIICCHISRMVTNLYLVCCVLLPSRLLTWMYLVQCHIPPVFVIGLSVVHLTFTTWLISYIDWHSPKMDLLCIFLTIMYCFNINILVCIIIYN